MTTMYQEIIICAVCGKESEQTFLGSTNAFGSSDMDTRPPEMQRSTMNTWVHECPHCGYCSKDLNILIDGAKNNVGLQNYKAILSDQSTSRLARQFKAYSFLQELANNFLGAGWSYLHAAWLCDDIEDNEKAMLFRQRAYDLFSNAMASGSTIVNQPGADELFLADICRRSGQMLEAMRYCKDGVNKTDDNFMRKLLKAEYHWAANNDSSCHAVEECL